MKRINAHAVFIAFIFVLSLFFLNNILHKGKILDNVHYINDLAFVSQNLKESLKGNELPLWTPYFYSGHPLLAIPENYMFDLNFIFVYLFRDIYLAMSLSLILYLFLAGLGMYLLAWRIFGSEKAAFIAAVIYMFNGFMHSFIILGHINILEGYALIPLILLCAHNALKSEKWVFHSMLAGALFALQILSGSMIVFFYTGLIVLVYMVFNLIGKNFANTLLKSAFIGIVIVAAALSLAAIKLLPVLEFTEMSSRAAGVSYKEFLGNPVNLKNAAGIALTNIGYTDTSAAIGITGIGLLIYGLAGFRKKIVAFSLFMVVFSLLFASGTFVSDIMYKIPGFDKLRHAERALVLFAFAGSILSAYGFVLLSEKLKKFRAYLKYENLFFAAVVFLILLELLLLQKVPLAAKITEPDDIHLLDYMGKDNSTFRTINLALKDIIGAAGYNYYAQKGISEAKGGGGIWINDYVNFVAVAQQSLSSRIFGILNVKYIVADRKLEAKNLTLVGRFNACMECGVSDAFGPYLYKNEHFLPRYYTVPNGILVVGDDASAKQLIYSLMLQNLNPENTVLVKGTRINDYDAGFLRNFKVIFLLKGSVDQDSIEKLRDYQSQNGLIAPDILNGQNTISPEEINSIFSKAAGNYTEIKIESYSNNKAVLSLNGGKGWLVASERFAYFPGWKAGISGKSIEMLKADNAITAMHLTGEKGKLVIEYAPESYRKGKLISLLASIIILAYFGWLAVKTFKRGDSNKA